MTAAAGRKMYKAVASSMSCGSRLEHNFQAWQYDRVLLLLFLRIQALSQVLEAKSKSEEAANSAAALAAADRKAKQYRREDSNMLNDYDSWVQGLLAKKGTATSPRSASPALGKLASSTDLRSPAAAPASPRFAADVMSRSASQPASPAHAAAGFSGDLDKYDRIAALLESRGVGTDSLSRSASARSVTINANGVGTGERRHVGAAIALSSSPSATLAGRPGFR